MNKKVSLVTGGSKGIGFAAAKALHDLGHVVIIAARNEEQLNQAVASFQSENVRGIQEDVSNPDSVKALFNQIKQDYGRLDLLFNNAGNNSPVTTIEDIPFEEWKRVFDVNIHATFLCAQEAIKIMKNQTPMGGRIIKMVRFQLKHQDSLLPRIPRQNMRLPG
nr:SDR family oxidoreductase [Zophobihabitans entericus]